MGTMYVVKRVLGSITSVLKGPGSAVPLEVENSGTVPVNLYFKTTNPGDTQVAAATPMPVTAASLPLPSGAATSALQGGGMPAALAAGGGLKVEGVAGGVAQPVSGTFWQATQPVSGTVTADQGTAGASPWPVVGNSDVVAVTFTLPAAEVAAADVLAATQEIAGAARANGKAVVLQSLTLISVDDAAPDLDLVFFNAATVLGTENSTPDIDDTEVLTVIGRVNVATTDWVDLGANRVACLKGSDLGLLMKPASDGTSLYVGIITNTTYTSSASGLTGLFGFLRD